MSDQADALVTRLAPYRETPGIGLVAHSASKAVSTWLRTTRA